ncbi:MAG: ATP-dependent metallopeptidase FtsH/Yme1/Tma family protein, partial [Sphaerochaetaceae bacterium]
MDRENEDKKRDEEQQEGKKDPKDYWTQNSNQSPPKRPATPGGPKFDLKGKNRVALALFVFLIVTFSFMLFNDGKAGTNEVPYSTFINYVESNQVSAVEIQDKNIITFALRNNLTAKTKIPYQDNNLMETLKNNGVQVTGTEKGLSLIQVLLQLLPWAIFIGFTVMLWRQSKGAGGNVMAFSKSRAKQYMDSEVKITFEDVAGQKEAKYELQEVVEFLKHPAKF